MARNCPIKGKGKGKGLNSAEEVTNLGGGGPPKPAEGEGREHQHDASCQHSQEGYENYYPYWDWNDPYGGAYQVEEVNQVEEGKSDVLELTGDWVRIPVCPDSGACKFVCPLDTAAHIPWEESEASRSGVRYRVANGSTVPNEGEKAIPAVDCNGNRLTSTWQGAKITKALGSIKEMVKAGNKVIFDQDEHGKNTSHIYNKHTKGTVPINDTTKGYEFDMWVKVGKNRKHVKASGSDSAPMEVGQVETHNQFIILDEDQNVNSDLAGKLSSGFARLVRAL